MVVDFGFALLPLEDFLVVLDAVVAFFDDVPEFEPLALFLVVLGAVVAFCVAFAVVGAVVCGAVVLTVVGAAVVAVVDVISVCAWVSTLFEFESQLERAAIAAPTAIVSEITLIISLLFKDISSTPQKTVYFCTLFFKIIL